jgi:hypothetical protein
MPLATRVVLLLHVRAAVQKFHSFPKELEKAIQAAMAEAAAKKRHAATGSPAADHLQALQIAKKAAAHQELQAYYNVTFR